MGNLIGNYFVTYQVDEDSAKGVGPLGKGDPNDFTLTEKDIYTHIPRYQAKAAEMLKCVHLHDAYRECANNSVLLIYSCKNEWNEYTSCVEHWSKDAEYRNQIIQEYLAVREEYRKTGRRRLYRGLKGETYVPQEKLKGFKIET